MFFTETFLKGVNLVEIAPIEDERGYFGRSWCQKEFELQGLNSRLVQCNVSFNKKRGTLRGMHYQIFPFEEAKLVRCTKGEIYDVVIDLRPQSETFKKWLSVSLTAESLKALFVPEGFAHGFQTLTNDAEVFYQMSEFHHPEASRGIRWNDPAFGIKWPIRNPIISEKDQRYPDWSDE